MARGLVHVEVDRDHEVEALERRAEAPAVRRREHRVAGEAEERADLALARRLDLLGERRRGQLAEGLGQAAHAGVPAPVAVADRCAAGARRRSPASGTWRRPPRRGGPRRGSAGPSRRWRACRRRRCRRRCASRRPRSGRAANSSARRSIVSAGTPVKRAQAATLERARGGAPPRPSRATRAAKRSGRAAPRCTSTAAMREEERGVGARADRDVLVGLAARSPSAAGRRRPPCRRARGGAQAAAHVGRRHHAAVRDHGVRADAEEVRGAVDVGHRKREGVAVEVVGGGEARAHVLRAGAVDVARAEGGVQRRSARAARRGCG